MEGLHLAVQIRELRDDRVVALVAPVYFLFDYYLLLISYYLVLSTHVVCC